MSCIIHRSLVLPSSSIALLTARHPLHTSLPRLFPAQIHQSLPLSSQSSGLDLPKGLGAAQKRNNRHDTHHRQCLEQVPRAIVQKEDSLHGDDGSEKEGVRERRIANGLGGVAKVAAKANPLQQLARNDPGPRRKKRHTPMNRTGTVARTASENTSDTILGGFLGSARKM